MQKLTFPSKSITKLDLSNKNLKEIPVEIFELRNLRSLNLSNNQLECIPKEISKLKMLENLDISNNRITNLLSGICDLKRLKNLNVYGNKITSLPRQISNLSRLSKLNIANNRIKFLPAEFSRLEKVKSLNLSKNLISDFPIEILKNLNLRSLRITHLPLKNFYIQSLNSLSYLKSIYAFTPDLNQESVSGDYFDLSKLKGNSFNVLSTLANNRVISENVSPITNSENISQILTETIEKLQNRIYTIFISYSHFDTEWLKKVQTNLKALKHLKIQYEIWDDEKIKGGDIWKFEIREALDKCDIAILLISTEFLASDFIETEELPPLLKKAEDQGTIILPLIVGHSIFTEIPSLSRFQSINNPNKPLDDSTKPEQDKILVALAKRVKQIIVGK